MNKHPPNKTSIKRFLTPLAIALRYGQFRPRRVSRQRTLRCKNKVWITFIQPTKNPHSMDYLQQWRIRNRKSVILFIC
jgi:hypothetical protein